MKACKLTNSTTIERACFDETKNALILTFRGSGKYVYYDVPADMFDALCSARSAGAFVNEKIKGRYRCRRDPERRRFGPNAQN